MELSRCFPAADARDEASDERRTNGSRLDTSRWTRRGRARTLSPIAKQSYIGSGGMETTYAPPSFPRANFTPTGFGSVTSYRPSFAGSFGTPLRSSVRPSAGRTSAARTTVRALARAAARRDVSARPVTAADAEAAREATEAMACEVGAAARSGACDVRAGATRCRARVAPRPRGVRRGQEIEATSRAQTRVIGGETTSGYGFFFRFGIRVIQRSERDSPLLLTLLLATAARRGDESGDVSESHGARGGEEANGTERAKRRRDATRPSSECGP